MLEGCVTVLYTGATGLFALVFMLASLFGRRSWLKPADSLWGLLLAMACAVWVPSMVLIALAPQDHARSACSSSLSL
jgi:hypothetical protein